jgi:hypothetical protein
MVRLGDYNHSKESKIGDFSGENMSKKIWAIIATIIIVVAGSAFLLQSGIHSMQSPVMAEAVRNGLMFTLQLEKTIYRLGEPVNVTATVTNISNQTITFEYGPSAFDYIVYNGTNNRIFERQWYEASPLWFTWIALAPGKNIVVMGDIWQQIFLYAPPNYTTVSVSPGTYYIVGIWYGGDGSTSLRTPPIQITITRIIER